jgi:hypothetical protein
MLVIWGRCRTRVVCKGRAVDGSAEAVIGGRSEIDGAAKAGSIKSATDGM